ncbi:hypothetical protein GCM10009816_15960 [Microbacterium aquimaris]
MRRHAAFTSQGEWGDPQEVKKAGGSQNARGGRLDRVGYRVEYADVHRLTRCGASDGRMPRTPSEKKEATWPNT